MKNGEQKNWREVGKPLDPFGSLAIHFLLPGIAHRDLKPENILCACENQVS